MRAPSALAALLAAATAVSSSVIGNQQPLVEQKPPKDVVAPRKLHGRFLHITDLHPDPYYIPGSDLDEKCHRKTGEAGYWGTARSSCDTPWTLVNETFRWIDENLKDQIDFVIWTGDSARHDNDVHIPRTSAEISDLNEQVANKMVEVFGDSRDPTARTTVPIVPTLGNNDIYPHNIMLPGPSKLTHDFVELWKPFIPEDQYHVFHKGAYFWQQVVPGKNGRMGDLSQGGLVVFSLNTLYFYDANKAVDGCDAKSEPGYEQMEWLSVQLALMRQRGHKVILTGHVPPAWTHAKMNWDESCWKKYVLWSRQYRDIIVAHLYGHMNLDHFMLLDSNELKPPHLKRPRKKTKSPSSAAAAVAAAGVCHVDEFSPEADPNLSVSSAETYLNSLREALADLVTPEKGKTVEALLTGDRWAEKYVLAHVSPSVVPNYFPTLRVMEYNTTGLVDSEGMLAVRPSGRDDAPLPTVKKKKGKKPDKGTVPDPPSRTAPPGPAYSVQPFTLMSYTQYFLNLTKYSDPAAPVAAELRKRGGKQPPKAQYEVEYDTKTDAVYQLTDLTVRSYIRLASELVDASSMKQPNAVDDSDTDEDPADEDPADADINKKKKKKEKKKKKKKKKKSRARDRVWYTFVRRAFVATVEDDELRNFEMLRTECTE